jgi:hypothetical protein
MGPSGALPAGSARVAALNRGKRTTMPAPKWHRNSLFGDGPRHALTREETARFRYLARAHRLAGRLTACAHDVAEALIRRLGSDGRLDPSHSTLAGDAACSDRTVRRAITALRRLGLVHWQRRIARCQDGTVEQLSSQYWLSTPAAAPVLQPGGQSVRQTLRVRSHTALDVEHRDSEADREARARRVAVAEAQLAERWAARGRLA